MAAGRLRTESAMNRSTCNAIRAESLEWFEAPAAGRGQAPRHCGSVMGGYLRNAGARAKVYRPGQ